MEPVSGKTEVIVPQVKEAAETDDECFGARNTGRSRRKQTGNAQEEIRRMVIPTWSAAQIAETCQKSGRCAGYCER